MDESFSAVPTPVPSSASVGPILQTTLEQTHTLTCDNTVTIGKHRLDPHPVGYLGEVTRVKLDKALRYSLNIVC